MKDEVLELLERVDLACKLHNARVEGMDERQGGRQQDHGQGELPEELRSDIQTEKEDGRRRIQRGL